MHNKVELLKSKTFNSINKLHIDFFTLMCLCSQSSLVQLYSFLVSFTKAYLYLTDYHLKIREHKKMKLLNRQIFNKRK